MQSPCNPRSAPHKRSADDHHHKSRRPPSWAAHRRRQVQCALGRLPQVGRLPTPAATASQRGVRLDPESWAAAPRSGGDEKWLAAAQTFKSSLGHSYETALDKGKRPPGSSIRGGRATYVPDPQNATPFASRVGPLIFMSEITCAAWAAGQSTRAMAAARAVQGCAPRWATMSGFLDRRRAHREEQRGRESPSSPAPPLSLGVRPMNRACLQRIRLCRYVDIACRTRFVHCSP